MMKIGLQQKQTLRRILYPLFFVFSILLISCEKNDEGNSSEQPSNDFFIGKTYKYEEKNTICEIGDEDYLRESTFTYSLKFLSTSSIVREVKKEHPSRVVFYESDTLNHSDKYSDDYYYNVENNLSCIKYYPDDKSFIVRAANIGLNAKFDSDSTLFVVDFGTITSALSSGMVLKVQ